MVQGKVSVVLVWFPGNCSGMTKKCNTHHRDTESQRKHGENPHVF
jgi:hypothetical protein